MPEITTHTSRDSLGEHLLTKRGAKTAKQGPDVAPSTSRDDGLYDAAAGRASGSPFQAANLKTPALAWHQRLASLRTRNKLHALEAKSSDAETWAAKHALFAAHVARMGVWQSAWWAGKQLLASLCWPRIAVSYVLFPAKLAKAQEATAPMVEALRRGGTEVRREAVVTRDHAMLDGLRVQCPEHAQAPGLLVCVGNGMQIGEPIVIDWLAELAAKTQRPVYAFNYRSVGFSVGPLHHTGAAVTDVATCLERVAAAGNGHTLQDVGVLGVSIGAGCAAAAVARLRRQGKLDSADGVGQFGALHSFRSLPAVIRSAFGWLPGGMASALLRLNGNDVLDTESTARRATLARKSVVANASRDLVVGPSAALGRLGASSRQSSRASFSSELFGDVGRAHCDIYPMLDVAPLVAMLQPDARGEKTSA